MYPNRISALKEVVRVSTDLEILVPSPIIENEKYKEFNAALDYLKKDGGVTVHMEDVGDDITYIKVTCDR